ncbi:MAG: hypothetical protein ABI398_04185 [Devosia sp.]
MKRYVIEREVKGIGLSDQAGLRAIARASNAALKLIATRVQ